MSFGLSRYDVASVTRRLELPQISEDESKPITLIVRHAGMANRDWESWRLKHPVVDDASDADRRSDLVTMISNVVLVGWEGISEDGAGAACTPESAQRFLTELAETCPDVWYHLVGYVFNISNFRRPIANPADLGKS